MFKLIRNFFKKNKESELKTFEIRVVTPLTGFEVVTLSSDKERKSRKANKTSFKKGHCPWNKGKKKGK